MKQTAIEWLFDQLEFDESILMYNIKDIFNKAKEMEKKQIIDAYLKDRPKATINKALDTWDKAEQYYNEKFKK
jgi:hypothetical protein